MVVFALVFIANRLNVINKQRKEITAVNEELDDAPELMNQEPYGAGWIIRMKLDDPSAVSSLMSPADYKAEIGE